MVGAGGLLAQNWDWHPDCAATTVIWIVEHAHGWFATLTEAGILAKIGLNDAGLGVCLNMLRTTADGGFDGTPIHLLLRQTLEQLPDRRRGDRRCSPSAKTSASSRGDRRHPRRRRDASSSHPGGANVIRGSVGAHTNHFLEPPRAGRDMMPEESPSTIPRLEVVRRQPLLDALSNHEATRRASAATSTRTTPGPTRP